MSAKPTAHGLPECSPLSTRRTSSSLDDEGLLEWRVVGVVGAGHHAADGDAELAGEGEVALVVAGHRHDGAGAVAGEDVVGDPDGDALAVDGVDGVGTEGHAGLLAIGGQTLDLRLAPRLCHVRLDRFALCGCGQLRHQRMLRRQHHEGRAVERVRSRGEDAQLLAAGVMLRRRGAEDHVGTLGATDPVGLHQPHRLRPLEALEGEQLVGVVGDAEEPLLQVALDHRRAAAPADAVGAFHLLASQHDLVTRAPVDRGHLAVGQAGLQELEEDPLVPAVVLGLTGDDLARPVEGRAHRAQLATHVLDVAHRPLGRMDTALDGGVLRRQAEGIEADGEEHVVAVHAHEARVRVGRRLDVPVADVQVTRGVGVHREQVVGRARVVLEVGVIEAELVPSLLPVGLDGRRVVALDRWACGVAVRDLGAAHACILTDAGLCRSDDDETPVVDGGP